MKTKNLRKNVMLLAPLFGLVALLVAFFIIGTSKNINVAYGMKSIINQSVVVAVVATGAIFIYTLGSFDISLGASVAVSALVGGIVYNKTESLVIMFAACLGVAVFIGLFNSVLASIFNLPVFVTTIAMLSVLNAWFGKCAQMAQTPDLEVILAVGNGSDFFGTAIEGTDVKIASVDAYAESYGTAMDGGMLDYLAGKFSASIGPIFIATYRAVLGSPIRTEDGNALALSQGYWVATSPEEFSEYYAVDSSVDSPAYTKGMLDGLLTADYASFEKFVSAYGFKDIQEEAK